MKQLKTIDRLQKVFTKVNGIEVALLYGSFGRNEGTPNSDIDIQILVNKDFEPILVLLKLHYHRQQLKLTNYMLIKQT